MEFYSDLDCHRNSSSSALVSKNRTEFGRFYPLVEDDVNEEEEDDDQDVK